MQRISTYMPMMDSRFNMDRQDFRMNEIDKGISSNRSINELRDNPVRASHVTRLDSSLNRSERYVENISYVKSQWQYAEAYIDESVSIFQRLRELAVQGANGTYSREDMGYMAVEVDALINELGVVVNAKDGTGKYIFSGDDVDSPAFRLKLGRVPGMERQAVVQFDYAGSLSRSQVEITDSRTVTANIQGNRIFWAEKQQVFGAVNTDGFVVEETERFQIDGVEVVLEPGDNVQSVIRKINDSGAPVRAFLDPVTSSLNLESTFPHQIWLEANEGEAMVSLGLISSEGSRQPPLNWNPDALVTGGSMLDQVIALRNALVEADNERIGGAILKGMDEGIDSLLRGLSNLGAQDERLSFADSRLGDEILAGGDWKSVLGDLDLTQAITEMKMIEYTKKAAYQLAGRILQPTLMDFLR